MQFDLYTSIYDVFPILVILHTASICDFSGSASEEDKLSSLRERENIRLIIGQVGPKSTM